MLLHVFMHELGHHYDRIHQKHLDSTIMQKSSLPIDSSSCFRSMWMCLGIQ
jgi:hypothetical protein